MESVNGSSPLPPTTSPYSDIYYYIEVILLALFFLLGVIGNSIVIDVYKPTRVQCVHVWFVFVLAIVDLISSGFLIPNVMFFTINRHLVKNSTSRSWNPESKPGQEEWLIFISVLLNGLMLLSCLLFVGIAIDRLEAVISPLHRRFTLKTARLSCFLVALFTFVFVVFFVMDDQQRDGLTPVLRRCSGDESDKRKYNVTKLLFDIIIVLSFLVIVVVYAIVNFQIRKLGVRRAETFRRYARRFVDMDNRAEEANLGGDDMEGGQAEEGEARDQAAPLGVLRVASPSVKMHKNDADLLQRTVRIATLITIFFIVSWLPSLMIQHWCIIDRIPILERSVYLNSVVNPIIYAVTNRDFRELIRHRFRDYRERIRHRFRD